MSHKNKQHPHYASRLLAQILSIELTRHRILSFCDSIHDLYALSCTNSHLRTLLCSGNDAFGLWRHLLQKSFETPVNALPLSRNARVFSFANAMREISFELQDMGADNVAQIIKAHTFMNGHVPQPLYLRHDAEIGFTMEILRRLAAFFGVLRDLEMVMNHTNTLQGALLEEKLENLCASGFQIVLQTETKTESAPVVINSHFYNHPLKAQYHVFDRRKVVAFPVHWKGKVFVDDCLLLYRYQEVHLESCFEIAYAFLNHIPIVFKMIMCFEMETDSDEPHFDEVHRMFLTGGGMEDLEQMGFEEGLIQAYETALLRFGQYVSSLK
uniref:Uncharacterized protein n=1 Tax=Percolomonas cosmopolitus TaxID=63605 RepID=A0A7S1KT73_9EUKA|mmetsp:Transcript_8066/g.29955  ORF Transcript_8066/g.29955 Transcript_8066/m.29955 type:complete len:326 (+) Transcript_8066:1-978(+)